MGGPKAENGRPSLHFRSVSAGTVYLGLLLIEWFFVADQKEKESVLHRVLVTTGCW